LTERTLSAAVAVVEATTALQDVRDGRVAICGASAGASLGLIAAAQPSLSDRVTVVAAVTPWARLERILALATTGHYEDGERLVEYPVTPLLRRVVALSVASALPASEDREIVLAALRCIDTDEIDACEELRRLDSSTLGGDARAVLDLLTNDDPGRFPALFAALPASVKSMVETLSPYTTAASLGCRVEIVRPHVDQYFPLGEALALVESLPAGYLTVTGVLDHTRPSLALGRLPDLIRFNRFVIRGLAAAAAP
jgi:hypothetical protein